jgi:hypothetical protein
MAEPPGIRKAQSGNLPAPGAVIPNPWANVIGAPLPVIQKVRPSRSVPALQLKPPTAGNVEKKKKDEAVLDLFARETSSGEELIWE